MTKCKILNRQADLPPGKITNMYVDLFLWPFLCSFNTILFQITQLNIFFLSLYRSIKRCLSEKVCYVYDSLGSILPRVKWVNFGNFHLSWFTTAKRTKWERNKVQVKTTWVEYNCN